MKTKIIYISGNEVFDMADIRAAFEEVRSTLGLARDTILFGVPVDSDDAFNNVNDGDIKMASDNPVCTDSEQIDVVTAQPTISAQNDDVVTPPAHKKANTRKSRARAKTDESDTDTPKSDKETKNTDIDTTIVPDAPVAQDNEKIIPILSILAAKSDDGINQPDNMDDADKIIDTDVTVTDEKTVIDNDDDNDETDDAVVQKSSAEIADMITDDAPDAPVEKTLEQLLESMTPLREDVIDETGMDDNDITDTDISLDEITDTVADDTDATLEQLATEFAATQDKIPTPQKNETHSKIGKLKNILPFKKAKRDDSGLMGDLFGWAGIAANDDDFSIPGFFTNAASKK